MTTICMPVAKPDDFRDLGPVDVGALRTLVERISDQAWARFDEGKENDYFCFHHTKHIVFRFIHQNRDPADFYDTPAWAVWSPILMPVMHDVVRVYGFSAPVFPKAMLARLEAGQKIDRHVDGKGSHLLTHKIHVPLATNPDATMVVNDRALHMELGRAYEVNNIAPHSVHNDGSTDRIHLIFEVCEGPD